MGPGNKKISGLRRLRTPKRGKQRVRQPGRNMAGVGVGKDPGILGQAAAVVGGVLQGLLGGRKQAPALAAKAQAATRALSADEAARFTQAEPVPLSAAPVRTARLTRQPIARVAVTRNGFKPHINLTTVPVNGRATVVTIGRGTHDVVGTRVEIDHAMISRDHLRIEWNPTTRELRVSDSHATNKSHVIINGAAMRADGSAIRLEPGTSEVAFSLSAEAGDTYARLSVKNTAAVAARRAASAAEAKAPSKGEVITEHVTQMIARLALDSADQEKGYFQNLQVKASSDGSEVTVQPNPGDGRSGKIVVQFPGGVRHPELVAAMRGIMHNVRAFRSAATGKTMDAKIIYMSRANYWSNPVVLMFGTAHATAGIAEFRNVTGKTRSRAHRQEGVMGAFTQKDIDDQTGGKLPGFILRMPWEPGRLQTQLRQGLDKVRLGMGTAFYQQLVNYFRGH